MMNDEHTTSNIFEQIQKLVPGVNQCKNELEYIQCISNYILHLQSQLIRKPHNKRDILRSLDFNQQSP
ncbi:unnamed protein product [Adineta steineri]|uniref:BHLH domain-containing protein n=1 Tax=Adineta steineri TaxID=433720 RepID=A0A814P8Q2_9BILA|nr:unnamed protein product [Adineta steineri]CAF1117566.1 unnamed protein product [Adineta steineri]CAF1294426.1 unnamed protein product [Adineta steineri]CAF1306433.1 unnamed protein product [Adineta steineri]CAF1419219.1 unnamed protein product [Adineta steineri]